MYWKALSTQGKAGFENIFTFLRPDMPLILDVKPSLNG